MKAALRWMMATVLVVAGCAPALADSEAASVERGAYLARVANCGGCHTAPGGKPFAGGLALESNLGIFHTPNITPDPKTGIGDWSRDAFWNALHEGERPDGSGLYPACPYPSLTRATRADVDAIYDYLQTVPAVENETTPHELDFPYGYRWLLGVWQALYFEPGIYQPNPEKSEAWNRGAYLVQGLGHCNECHRRRNFMGAVSDDYAAAGGTVHGWYAPSLNDSVEAGLQHLEPDAAAAFLRTGKSDRAVMMGPMAEVVFESLQYLTEADAAAMATYLTSLPDQAAKSTTAESAQPGSQEKLSLGRRVYEDHCQDCHGEQGEGTEGVTALAGNRGVTVANPANVVNTIHLGGFPASVPGHPRPHGMPPHYDLTDREVAAVATYIRQSWGNHAPAVRTIQVGDR